MFEAETLTVASFWIYSSGAPRLARPISWENWAKDGSANNGTCPNTSWHTSLQRSDLIYEKYLSKAYVVENWTIVYRLHCFAMQLKVCLQMPLATRALAACGMASTLKVEDTGTAVCFALTSHFSDLDTILVAILLGAWHCKVNARTNWSSGSVLWLGEIASLIWNFFSIVAAHTIVSAD